ncbi:MAG: exodeoxyribonuclease III [Defluviitaleaceae bacterium]|nr:exodeoxyribonuclease III [Defluviitaleaceae bacterium]
MIYNFASWNVNGLRACIKKGFADFFLRGFDIFAVQETKMQRNQSDFSFEGYNEYWNSADKKGYSGTLIYCKDKPLQCENGLDKNDNINEGRVITLSFEKFFFVNVYSPNSQHELARLNYRMSWEDSFREHTERLAKQKPVIICGDFNVAHNEIDLKNPKANINNAGFTLQEREKFSALLKAGFFDSFRRLYPNRTEAYTWWSYMPGLRERNVGWRIDYFLLSENLSSNIKEAKIFPDVYGSDHCPISLTVDL